jgi:hypothetical protein
MKLIGYSVPATHGPGNTGARISYIRERLPSRGGNFCRLTPTTKSKWTNVLQHNRHDCVGMRAVVMRAAADLGNSRR